jgi:glycosyltransferase involved in cell wall biosynthesis
MRLAATGRPSVCVVITTYNWPQALRVCLESFRDQTSRDFEILVADDGSGPATREAVAAIAHEFPVPVTHVWHPDQGFRLAAIRNRAIARAAGDYIVQMDGDCFVLRDFVARHIALREPGMFVSGRRTWLGKHVTGRTLANGAPASGSWPYWFAWSLAGQVTGPFELIGAPSRLPFRYKFQQRYQRAQTCNLGYWRADGEAVGGYDERYVDHGLEDSDFVVRMIRHGVRRKEGAHGSIVLHLDHPRRQRGPASRNAEMFAELLASDRTMAGHLLVPGTQQAA